jgi:hypothetical protein
MDNFKKIVKDFQMLMKKIKNECNDLDKTRKNDNDAEVINYLKNKYEKEMDAFFERLWKVSDYMTEGYEKKAKYLISAMDKFFVDDIETVSYIRKRPLGYAGDFVTMNFIYDFNNGRFLGENYYQKFINNYTCTIKVSNSNIGRKRIIKEKLENRINNSDNEQKILSLGSGPAREITELINEKKILKPVTFYCLDFEEKAIQSVKDELSKMSYDSSIINIRFLHENLLKVIKKGEVILPKKSLDFVYISGVFDYFSPKVCQKILLNMLPLIKESDAVKLLFFNMSSENETHRAFYEMLARWEMTHRTLEELLDWEKETAGYKFNFKKEDDCPSYHIIEIK